MELLKQIALIFLSSLGIISGFIVSKNSEEELEFGKIYFRIIHSVLFVSIIGYTIYFLFNNIILASFLPSLVFLLVFYTPKRLKYFMYSAIIGLIAGISLVKFQNYIFLSVIFVILLIHGSLIYIESKRLKKNINIQGLINSIIFMIIAIITIFIL